MSIIFVAVFVLCFAAPEQPMKSLFVLGDSISMHYGPYLEEDLRGTFRYDRKRNDAGASDLGVPEGPNGGDSRMVLEYLKARRTDASFRPDILLVNCGLHDIKRDVEREKEIQVASRQYRENLEEIHSVSQEIGTRLIWVRTTPVVDRIHNSQSRQFHRYEADLVIYNEIADSVFQSHQVPIVDLNRFTKGLGEEAFSDHVHYSQEIRALQAAFIAGFLQHFK